MVKPVTGRKILIVEDNRAVSEEFASYFGKRQNAVFCAETLKEAGRIINSQVLDAIILDVILPDGDGLDLFTRYPKLPPVIIMTTLGTDCDVLEGFSAGAADYVIKPCVPEVLEARLSLRLLSKSAAVVSLHGLSADVTERTATYNGKALALTGSEFNVLYFFLTHADTFFTASEIYENVWHAPSLKTTTIKYHISNLRQKLLTVAGKPMIITEFGKGYAFMSEGKRQ